MPRRKAMFAGRWSVETVNLNAYMDTALRIRELPRAFMRVAIILNINAALSRCKLEANTLRTPLANKIIWPQVLFPTILPLLFSFMSNFTVISRTLWFWKYERQFVVFPK